MRNIAAIFMVLFSFCSFADSSQAILISPLNRDSKPSVTNVINIYGECGGSVIAILGVEPEALETQEYFKVDSSGNPDLQVRTGGKNISYGYLLSDYNVVQCVHTKGGDRLLVGKTCSGSACSDAFNYYVIDPKNGSVFPGKGYNRACDLNCANKILGFKYLK